MRPIAGTAVQRLLTISPTCRGAAVGQNPTPTNDRYGSGHRCSGDPVDTKVGIGIASVFLVADSTGTGKPASCACVGEPMNLAARPEAHIKAVDCALSGT